MTNPALTPEVLEKLTALHADGVGDGIRAQSARNAYTQLLDRYAPALLAAAQRVQELEADLRAHRAELAAIDAALGPLTEATRQAQVRLLVERLGQSQVRDYQWIGFARSVGLAVNCLYATFPEGNDHIVAKVAQLVAARQAEKGTP